MKLSHLIRLTALAPIAFLTIEMAAAQTIERSYPGTACTSARYADLFPDEAGALDGQLDMYTYSGNGRIAPSIDRFLGGGAGRDDDGIIIFCPVQREKVGSSQTSGAKFYAYIDRQNLGFVSCTLASTKAHNGVIVSSATRSIADGVGANGPQSLARSTAPSNGYGPYVFYCTLRGVDPGVSPFFLRTGTALYSYRIKEF